MANQWFRLYAEFAHDPKVQMLSEVDQRRLIMLFCIRCNGDVTLQDDEVTFQLRISNIEWQITKATFIAKGFIDSDNEVLNWDKRQYISDSSAERVARHRAKKTNNVTNSNVTVTPPEQNRYRTDTDTEQIKNIPMVMPEFNINITEYIGDGSSSLEIKKYSVETEFDVFWSYYPKKVGKEAARRSWDKVKPILKDVLNALYWQKESDQWAKSNGQFIPNPATYLNQGRWQDEKPVEVTF